MRRLCWFLALVLALAAAPAAAVERPLLEVETEGTTIAGERVRVYLELYRNGRLVVVGTRGEDAAARPGASFLAGTVPQPELGALRRTLGRIDIGTLEAAGCGSTVSDGYVDHVVTWHGRAGRRQRLHFFAVPDGCPSGVRELMQAIGRAVEATRARSAAVLHEDAAPLQPFALPLD